MVCWAKEKTSPTIPWRSKCLDLNPPYPDRAFPNFRVGEAVMRSPESQIDKFLAAKIVNFATGE